MGVSVETSAADPAARSPRRSDRWVTLAPWLGLAAVLALVVAAFWVPHLTGWDVHTRAPRSESDREVPPLHGLWEPKWFGPGTLPAVAIALLGWRLGPGLAARLGWRPLLAVSFAVSLAWLSSLALVDGPDGFSRVLGASYEYLPTAREIDTWGDVGTLLSTYVDRIPYAAAPDNWPTHVAGHPPLMLLFFVALCHVGLGSDLGAGLAVTVVAAALAPAVLVCLRALGVEQVARRAAPFLVLSPAAVFMAVSADAVIAVVAAWGLACLALATSGRRWVAWSVLAGLLLGCTVLMSYGMPLLGLLAVAVLVAGRSWRPLPVAVVSALVPVLAMAALGFAWWDAFPVLQERYMDGIAKDRPMTYWWWGNLAALTVSAGPVAAAGLAHVLADAPRSAGTWWRSWRAAAPASGAPSAPEAGRAEGGASTTPGVLPAVLLTLAGFACIAAADASGMSKAEVERIWVPFVPWLLVSAALLPPRWRGAGLLLQVVWAVAVQQLFYTSW